MAFSKERCVELAQQISKSGGDLTAQTAQVAAAEGFTPEQAFKLAHFVNVVTHQGLFGEMRGGDRYVEFDVCDPARLQTLMGTSGFAQKTAAVQDAHWHEELDYVAPLPVGRHVKEASAPLDWVSPEERSRPVAPYTDGNARYLLRQKLARATDAARVEVTAYQVRCEELAAAVSRGAVRFDKLAHDILALAGPQDGPALVRQVASHLPAHCDLDVDQRLCYPGTKFAGADCALGPQIRRALEARSAAYEATTAAATLRERLWEVL